jgi:hypothetical protein
MVRVSFSVAALAVIVLTSSMLAGQAHAGDTCKTSSHRIGECFVARGYAILEHADAIDSIVVIDEKYRSSVEGHEQFPEFYLSGPVLQDVLDAPDPNTLDPYLIRGTYELCHVRPDRHIADALHRFQSNGYAVCIEAARDLQQVDHNLIIPGTACEDKAHPCAKAPPDFKNPPWQDQGREFRGDWFHVRTPRGYHACAEPPAAADAGGVVIPIDRHVACAERRAYDEMADWPDYVSVKAIPEWLNPTFEALVQERCKGKTSGLVGARVELADIHINGWQTVYCTGTDPHGRYYRIALAHGGDGVGDLVFRGEARVDAKNRRTADALLRRVLQHVKLYKP